MIKYWIILLMFARIAFGESEIDISIAKRDSIQIPEDLWSEICDSLNFSEKMGVSSEDMAYFRSSTDYILETVDRLFRDIRKVPTFSGNISTSLMENHRNPENILRTSASLLGERVGTGLNMITEDKWNSSFVSDEMDCNEALIELIITKQIDDINEEEFRNLPGPLKELILRLVLIGLETKPYTESFVDYRFFNNAIRDYTIREDIYTFVKAPWKNESLKPIPESYDAIGEVDFAYMSLGGAILLGNLNRAIEEYFHAVESARVNTDKIGTFKFNTVIGEVLVNPTDGYDTNVEYFLILDLDGDDIYTGHPASSKGLDLPISLIIDLEGNDKYIADGNCGVACGLLGYGAIFDYSGNDEYNCIESGIGCGLYGVGAIFDFEGEDSYKTDSLWGIGTGCVGVGLVNDFSGNDNYYCYSEGEGFAQTMGVGILLDIRGDDNYLTPDSGRYSDAFKQTISFAQGAGFGRRADMSDGHSLAGGFGILVDGAGDDFYSGQVYAQGTGYWWGMGILEDLDGDDTYHSIWYSMGSAPHFAIGSMVDSRGNDSYNKSNINTMCQYQACARDCSFGLFIDGEGDDYYLLRNRCAGSADLNSMAIFWDKLGNDIYEVYKDKPYKDDPPMGSSAVYEKFNSIRDDIPSIGIFIDTNGKDSYPDSEDFLSGNDRIWMNNNTERFRSLGMDIDYSGY